MSVMSESRRRTRICSNMVEDFLPNLQRRPPLPRQINIQNNDNFFTKSTQIPRSSARPHIYASLNTYESTQHPKTGTTITPAKERQGKLQGRLEGWESAQRIGIHSREGYTHILFVIIVL
jgi:hypothetical protein